MFYFCIIAGGVGEGLKGLQVPARKLMLPELENTHL